MSGRYEVNYGWMDHPGWNPASRLTLAASILAGESYEPSVLDRVNHALEEWLGEFSPCFLTIDGRPELVAYAGGTFVDVAPATDARALTPTLLISSTGQEACESVAQVADDLYEVVTAAYRGADFHWEERDPRPFGRAG